MRPGSKFRRSSRSRPCPICGGQGCGQGDGIVLCWREPSDEVARSGAWIHRSDPPEDRIYGGLRITMRRPSPLAPIDRRNEVYSALLEALTLESVHADHLSGDRRLSDATIIEQGFASVPGRERAAEVLADLSERFDLTHVPGFYKLRRNPWWLRFVGIEGFFIPLRDAERRIAGLQIRRWPYDGEKSKYLLLSTDPDDEDERGAIRFPQGARSDAPAHYARPHRCADGVVITEGALKANIAAELRDLCVVGFVAAGTFSKRIGWELRDALPQLRRVLIAYDADKSTNDKVARQIKRLKQALNDAGIDPVEWTWPAELGKGLDDYLIASASL
jgi:Domain of unknown function (DUF3854)